LETLVLKKFVISSDCRTGPKEILDNGKGGFLFKVGNYNELASKILSFSKNKNKYQSMINFSHKRLNRFHIEKNLEKYEKFIEKYL